MRNGLGGARLGSERLSGTARTAGALYNVLDTLRTGGTPPELGVNAAGLAGRSARDVGDAIADAIRPVDGTQDAESSRDAVSRAIADLLEKHPDADVAALNPENIEYVTQAYIANDLSTRIELDVGNAILDKAPDPVTGVRRLEEVKQYVRESVAASFRERRERGEILTRAGAAALCAQVIRDTLDVFEEYTK